MSKIKRVKQWLYFVGMIQMSIMWIVYPKQRNPSRDYVLTRDPLLWRFWRQKCEWLLFYTDVLFERGGFVSFRPLWTITVILCYQVNSGTWRTGNVSNPGRWCKCSNHPDQRCVCVPPRRGRYHDKPETIPSKVGGSSLYPRNWNPSLTYFQKYGIFKMEKSHCPMLGVVVWIVFPLNSHLLRITESDLIWTWGLYKRKQVKDGDKIILNEGGPKSNECPYKRQREHMERHTWGGHKDRDGAWSDRARSQSKPRALPWWSSG